MQYKISFRQHSSTMRNREKLYWPVLPITDSLSLTGVGNMSLHWEAKATLQAAIDSGEIASMQQLLGRVNAGWVAGDSQRSRLH